MMNKLVLNKFIILSEEEKSAIEIDFSNNLNIFVGKNKSGKSSLAKSILYTLGCDVVFENSWKNLGKTYLLFFSYGNQSYSIKRVNLVGKYNNQKGSNVFEVIDLETQKIYKFNKTTEFAFFLNELFGLKIRLLTRKKLETSIIYPNHMFLLNYLDQDTSWGNLLTDTFNNQSFLLDYKNSILDFFTGLRTNKYYELSNKIKELQNEKHTLKLEYDSLKKLYEINLKKINKIENIDVDVFKESIKLINNHVEAIIGKEAKLKKKLSSFLYERSKLLVLNENHDATLEKSDLDASGNCPVCGLHRKMETKNLFRITTNMYELRKERDMNLVRLADLELKIEKTKADINLLSEEQKSMSMQLRVGNEKLDLIESMKNFGIIELSQELEKEFMEKLSKIESLNSDIKMKQKILKSFDDNEQLVSDYYKNLKRIFNKLKINFKFKNDANDFMRFSTSYSGTDRVLSIIGFYLNVNRFTTQNYDIPTFPFILDTLYKEDFDDKNELNLIEVYILEVSQLNQQQLLFTSDKAELISYLTESNIKYNVIEGYRKLLDVKKYDDIKKRYAQFNL
ncbi:AAA family ATPase [Mycoplasmatota bacterium]|nr:AAA family ATPase [Mycoplasmatota bacterium]